MTLVNLGTVVLLAEIATLTSLGLLGMVSFIWLKHRRTKRALSNLVASIKKHSADRNAVIDVWLKETCHFDAEKAAATSIELQKAELEFYQQLVVALFTNNVSALTGILQHTDRFVTAYRAIIAAVSGNSSSVKTEEVSPVIEQLTTQVGGLTQQLESMRQNNQDLTLRLSEQQNEMTQMLKEYASAFRSAQMPATHQMHTQDKSKNTPPPISSDTAPSFPENNVETSPLAETLDVPAAAAQPAQEEIATHIAEIPDALLNDIADASLKPKAAEDISDAIINADSTGQVTHAQGLLAEDNADLSILNAAATKIASSSGTDQLDHLLASFGADATPAPLEPKAGIPSAPDIDELLNSALTKSVNK